MFAVNLQANHDTLLICAFVYKLNKKTVIMITEFKFKARYVQHLGTYYYTCLEPYHASLA